MFSNIGWSEMFLLVVVGLVVLGPERLPEAIRWTGQTIRQVRSYLSGATRELREEFGPEFDDLREPLGELQKLRGMTPKAAITKHLLDGDDSWITGDFQTPAAKPQTPAVKPQTPASGPPPSGPSGGPVDGPAPFDTDAT